MALAFFDGWGYAPGAGGIDVALRKYTESTPQFLQYFMSNRPGQGASNAITLENTAFSGYAMTKAIGSSPVWTIGFEFSPNHATAIPRELNFLRLESGPPDVPVDGNTSNSNTALVVTIAPDGELRFYKWTPYNGMKGTNEHRGTELTMSHPVGAVHTLAMNPAIWTYIEIKVEFGIGGSIEVHYNDQLVSYFNGGLDVPDTGYPDRFAYYQESFGTCGVALGSLYIADDFLGPCRATSHLVASDGSVSWTPSTAGHAHYSLVNDAAADTSTYITGSGGYDWFGLSRVPCFGKILGVSLCAAGERTSGDTDFEVKNRTTSPITLGSTAWLPSGWMVYMTPPAETSVFTGTTWTAGEVTNSTWGVHGGGKITQLWVEVLTSLRNTPYSCGDISNYAF